MKRIFSCLLSLIIILSCLPGAVLADTSAIFYDSITLLADDIASDSLGANSVDETSAVLSVRYDERYYVALVDDIEINEVCEFENAVIDLCGHNVTANYPGGFALINSLIIDSSGLGTFSITSADAVKHYSPLSLNNSTAENIIFKSSGSGAEKFRVINATGNCTVNNCNFNISGIYDRVTAIYALDGSTLLSEGCLFAFDVDAYLPASVQSYADFAVISGASMSGRNMRQEDEKTYFYGVVARVGECTVENCNINLANYCTSGRSCGIYATSECPLLTVADCDIVADAHYLYADGGYKSLSIAIQSYAERCHIFYTTVRGAHSGVQLSGTENYIVGSILEGTGHGGAYFCKNQKTGEDGNYLPVTSYVINTTIAHIPAYGIFAGDASNPLYSSDNRAAFYIGGSSGANGITVYMDGCTIIGDKYSGVLRGSSSEYNNKLYMSNTSVGTPMRVDNDTMILGVGKSVSITPESEFYWNRKGLTTYSKVDDSGVFFDETAVYCMPLQYDFNCDMMVNLKDVEYLLNSVLFLDGCHISSYMDVNFDGSKSIEDAEKFLYMVLFNDFVS